MRVRGLYRNAGQRNWRDGGSLASTTVTIVDNDPAPVFGFESLGQQEGNYGSSISYFTLPKPDRLRSMRQLTSKR